MKNSTILSTLCWVSIFINLLSTPNISAQTSMSRKPLSLVWFDEFNYSGFPDPAKWNCDTAGNKYGWGNNEAQWYTCSRQENALVDNGMLKIIARLDSMNGKKYTSARLTTKNKGDWKYGRVEVMAKIPGGRGMWPAIWMLPTENAYGKWPNSGEIDIMENVGFDPFVIVASAHTQTYNHMIGTQKNNSITIADCYDTFHLYALEWEPEEYRVYIDNRLYFTFKNEHTGPDEWPFDQKFHLILNVAVGGNWGGMKGIDDAVFPATMEVDYVKVYQ